MGKEADPIPSSTGLVPADDGWFVLNARDARWSHAPGRSAVCDFEGEVPFAQIGINLSVLNPGEAMSRYHWEVDQEDFLVLAGEAALSDAPCLVLAVGAREQTEDDWGAYPVDPTAIGHGAGVEQETRDPAEAHAGLPQRRPTPFNSAWLPD